MEEIKARIITLEDFRPLRETIRNGRGTLVFTNGCFDIIHRGHIAYLSEAASLGSMLIIGLNTDSSVRRLKGPQRPLQDQETRAMVLASLRFVDYVIYFDEDTPMKLISEIQPDILVKGGDYVPDEIVGYDVVTSYGGKVMVLPYLDGFSTTGILSRI